MPRGNWKLCVWVCNKLATGIKRMACFGKNVFTSDAKGSMCISHGHNPEYPSVKTEMQNLCKRTTVGEACLINKVLWKGNQWGNPVSLPACPPILVCCSRMANDAAKPLQSIREKQPLSSKHLWPNCSTYRKEFWIMVHFSYYMLRTQQHNGIKFSFLTATPLWYSLL